MQTREVNGQKQVFDEHLTAWRPWAPLDDMGQRLTLAQPTQQPATGEKKFLCPDCGERVEKLTTFTGWETESIHPRTGETIELTNSERDEVHDETYQCRMGCGWTAGYEWIEEMLYADQDEEEEEEIFQLKIDEAPVQQPQLFTWSNSPDRLFTFDPF